MFEDEGWVDPAQEALEDEYGAQFGDPCYCPRHPRCQIRSADGMFDGECGECEFEMYAEPVDPVAEAKAAEERRAALEKAHAAACAASNEDDILF
jgi:hypothetical protein